MGLNPGHQFQRQDGAIQAELLDQAILLRREVPTSSVKQIIQILEWEGKADPSLLKCSTLQGKLTEAGVFYYPDFGMKSLNKCRKQGVFVQFIQQKSG